MAHVGRSGIPVVRVPFSFKVPFLSPFFLRQLGQIVLCHQKMLQV
jgi:hypothetical protein